jgi:ketosteroid isomerase-like protein
MITGFRLVLAATAISALGVFPYSASADVASDEAEILEIWSTYTEARVAGDAETWLGLWDKEGIRMPPGAPAIDYATFAPGTAERFANPPASMKINSEEIEVAGDWAYSRGSFTVNNAVEGKFLTIFRRQEDGSWRIYRDSFSMNSN